MLRQLTILILILLVTLSLRAQKISSSKLYDTKGRLLADTTLIITKKQLKKWKAIEDTLLKAILSKIIYPQFECENALSGKVIISFTVDIFGKFDDFQLEKHFSKLSQESIKNDIKDFKKESFRSIQLLSGTLMKEGLKSRKKYIYRYYLPIEFIANAQRRNKRLKNGWLSIEHDCENLGIVNGKIYHSEQGWIPAYKYVSDSLLATFYNKTLAYYYSGLPAQEDQTKFGCILYQTDFDSGKLIKNVGANNFEFFSSEIDRHTFLKKPYKINNGRSIYWITHNKVGRDTVDIDIGKWVIENASKRTLSLNIQCGGTMGYVPNGRFIFNKTTNDWDFTAPKEQFMKKSK